jgi:hypothetical protein
MGTDIILFVVEKDDKATLFYDINRDYTLYPLMGFNKRADRQEVYHRGRGLPRDTVFTAIGHLYRPGNGDHDSSWMDADEFDLVKNRYEYEMSDNDDTEPYVWPYDHILDLARSTGGRIVFWFNS